ncbi:MAG: hypothetical protein LBF97_00110 [Elusimicrobiota bacterium]|jgi:outer membrane lipoprotein-sorting protein|nr:hypothetical protein [Elusimicrobiota bacterium]
MNIFLYSQINNIQHNNFFLNNKQAEKVFNQLSENGKKIENFRLDFRQEIQNFEDALYENDSLTEKSKEKDDIFDKGEIFFRNPNNFKVSYNKDDIIYLFDGLNLKIFEKAKNQLLIININNNNSTPENFFGDEVIDFFKFEYTLLDKYEITSFWEDKNLETFNFIFKDKKTNYKVILTIDNKNFYPKKIIWDKEYSKFIITIKNLNLNFNIEDSEFEIENIIKKDTKIFEI